MAVLSDVYTQLNPRVFYIDVTRRGANHMGVEFFVIFGVRKNSS
jgi:hypothetical protein